MDSSLWPQRTVPKLPSGTNGCQTLKTATLNTFYFCQKRPLCQPPPSPTPPPYSHFVRKVKLRLAYRLAFVIFNLVRSFHTAISLPFQRSNAFARRLAFLGVWHHAWESTGDNLFFGTNWKILDLDAFFTIWNSALISPPVLQLSGTHQSVRRLFSNSWASANSWPQLCGACLSISLAVHQNTQHLMACDWNTGGNS